MFFEVVCLFCVDGPEKRVARAAPPVGCAPGRVDRPGDDRVVAEMRQEWDRTVA